MNGWISVETAAVLVGRTRAAIYMWIKQGRLATARPDRITLVSRRDVLKIDADIKLGRPVGSARTRRAG